VRPPKFILLFKALIMKSIFDKRVFILLVIFCSSFALKAQPTVLTSDSLALVTLYNSTNGPGWTDKTNWLTGPVNTWFGVTISSNSVTSLSFDNNQLIGSIPQALGNLSALTFLNLNNNQLTGPIPPELGNLSLLSFLSFANNQLSGSIPSTMGNLSALTFISLGNNQLSGAIPSALWNLTLLTSLSLNTNQLTGTIPPEIANLSALTGLNLANNQLSGPIPPSLGDLSALTNLILSGNQLNGPIPPELGNLSLLTYLYLQNNQLTGPIPPELGNLSLLTQIFLDVNKLSGTIPPEFGNLSSLLFLVLSDNKLSGTIPPELANCSGLLALILSNNQLTGSIPIELGNFSNLLELEVNNNQLTGAVPTELGNLTSLQEFNISNNQLTDLPNLTTLSPGMLSFDVSNNLFTFEDLEPNTGISGINYNPQLGFGSAQPFVIPSLSPLNLSFVVGGSANTYQWKKGGTNVGINSNSYSVPATSTADAGTYTLQVTSALVPGLTLISKSQTVSIKLDGLFEWADGGELTQEGFDATGLQVSDQNYGAQWGDFNNDGFEDIFVTGFQTTERSYLYKNNGNGTFSKLPNSAYFFTSGRSITWGDYNNDGLLDCFAPAYATDSVAFNSLFKNNGNETFTRVPLTGTGASGTWSDIDNDGFLDLLYTDNTNGDKLTLNKNNGGTGFTPNASAFISSTGWNPVAVDVNNDDLNDIFVPQGITQASSITRALYTNDGDGTFTLNSTTPLVTDILAVDRGASWADIDNDGDYDAFICSNTEHRFYINDGAGNFTAQTSLAVLGETLIGGRGSAFADYDNDGFVDLLVYSNLPQTAWNLFRNNGNGTFTKAINQTFRIGSVFGGASFADYNNDGFIDIALTSYAQDFNGLYRNKGNSNNWIQLKLVGNISNKSAIGAKVDVFYAGLRARQQIIASNGAHNQNSLVAQFGLGSNTSVDSVLVTWPSGLQQKVMGLAINRKWSIKENNFEIDSLALVALYNATGGPGWTTKTNWLTGPVTTWAGVTFTNGSLTSVNLPNNNIVGKVPEDFANHIKVQTINLSNNKITSIPDLTSLPFVTSVNVSANALDFSSLEKNASVTGLTYGNQAGLGVDSQALADVGTDYSVAVDAGGISDQYQWKRNGTLVSGATSKTYTIQAINRSNMGDYTCEITNPNVPGLLLTSARQRVLATATLKGRLLVHDDVPATVGDMLLFKINTGAFDTTAVKSISTDGTYLIEKVILDDYELVGFADTLVHTDALPTYYTKTIYWEEADTLYVENNLDNLDILSEFKPAPPKNGVGEILGFFEEPDNAGGRTEKNKRVKNSGASLRRVERAGRAEDVILTLIAHTFTNENGEFVFTKLDPGVYRLNLQYPGFPMDTTSFIDIPVGTGLLDKQVAVEAQVIDNKIVVTKRIITGWEEPDSPYSVYPNPVKDIIRIHHKSGSSKSLGIQMFNSSGRVMDVPIRYQRANDEWMLDVSKLAYGSYLIRVKENNSSRALRVIISD